MSTAYRPEGYGEVFADVYDVMYPDDDHVAALVALLAELAGEGELLEIGVGTGRVALPLAARGVAVHGIEASPQMLEALLAKEPPATLTVERSDMTDYTGRGGFAVATLLAQTLFLLPNSESQRACLASAAEALAPGGLLVVEAYTRVPAAYRDPGRALSPVAVDPDMVVLVATDHDPVEQRLLIQHIVLGVGEPLLLPVQLRYAWPTELDLMAEAVGLRLRHRWSGPDQQPVTAASETHLSIYERV